MIDKKIFVIGTGRCGTTWLGHWLRQHPKTFGGPETHIFEILKNIINPSWNQGIITWVPERVVIENLRLFISSTFEACKFRKENQNHLVEHSWIHYYSKPFIQQIFPDAYFIHVYRDGRNVVESKLRTNQSPQTANQAWEYINLWINTMNNMLDNSTDDTLNVKYEDLIECPEQSKSITSYIGIDHHKDIDSWEFPVNTSNFEYNPNRWQSLPDDIQGNMMQGPMLDLLKELGYE